MMSEKPVKQSLGRVVKATEMPDLSRPFNIEQLAKAITAKRTGMKLKLVDVASALEISKPTLIKIEKGDTNVKFGNLLMVMEYLGLSFALLSDDPDHNPTKVNDDEWF